jgi:hypothetical protein
MALCHKDGAGLIKGVEPMEKPQFKTLREKIAYENIERVARYAAWDKLWHEATAAGYAAGDHMTPKPMAVVEAASIFSNEPKPGAPVYICSEGPCGFAWVNVKGANKGFGAWLLKTGKARKGYYGGAEIWIHAHNQSYERKYAHARAMAHIFKEAGVDCYASGRLD